MRTAATPFAQIEYRPPVIAFEKLYQRVSGRGRRHSDEPFGRAASVPGVRVFDAMRNARDLGTPTLTVFSGGRRRAALRPRRRATPHGAAAPELPDQAARARTRLCADRSQGEAHVPDGGRRRVPDPRQ